MIAADPYQGGATWAVLQYALGLERLGHNVVFVEQIDPDAVKPEGVALDRSRNAAYFDQVTTSFGLADRSALLVSGSRETIGLPYARLVELGRDADILINISGILTDETLLSTAPVRIYLDLDPAFNQLWHASGIDMRFGGHTHFVTVGQALGSPQCAVPTCGLEWITTVPPVVLDQWPGPQKSAADAYTTIGHWRAYGSIEYEGVHYGQKVHSMRPLMSLPTLTGARFTMALAIHPDEEKDLSALAENRWALVDPQKAAGTPERYRSFIQGSRGELGIAKLGYVVSQSGWFSDRSVCYLASGRPVIAQETGFTRFLPSGEGLLSFDTTEDIVAAVEDVEGDYTRHSNTARAIAEEHFDSDRVLARLVERVGSRS
jgi:hypothetical protein